MAKKKEDALFVGIANRDGLRKGMLECSKGILEAMKYYESFKAIREERIKLVNQFRNDLREVSRLINGIKENMPQLKELKKTEVKKVEVRPKLIQVERLKEKGEIEKLEAELNKIEQKLDSLS